MIDVSYDNTKSVILHNLLHALYEPPLKQEYTNIGEVVQENLQIVLNIKDKNTPRYVSCNGKNYFNKYIPNELERTHVIYNKYSIDAKVELDDSIRCALLRAIEERDLILEEQQKCSTYLRSLLNICNTLADIRELLPNCSRDTLIQLNLLDTNSIVSIPENEIKALKHKWEDSENFMKERIFLNLLTRD